MSGTQAVPCNEASSLTGVGSGSSAGLAAGSVPAAQPGVRQRRIEHLLRLSRVSSALVVALGMTVLVGWALDVDRLKSLSPALASMKANTALLFVLLGCALHMRRGERRGEHLRRALALVVALVAAVTLSQDLFGFNLGIDELLFSDPASRHQGLPPGRMAPATAGIFLLLGLALHRRRDAAPDGWPIRAAVALAGLVSFISLAGYLFGVGALYGVGPFRTIALHTVLGFLTVCLAFVTARPEEGLLAVATTQGPAGVLLRRALPAAALGPLLMGELLLVGRPAPASDAAFRVAVVTVGNVVIVAAVLAIAATLIHRSDVQLGASEERFRLMVEAIADHAIIMLDLDGRVATWNSGAERFNRYGAAEILGQHVSVFYTPADVASGKPARELEAARREGRLEAEDYRVRKGGECFWASIVVSLLRDADGAPLGFVQVIRDVTKLRRANEQFRVAIEAAPMGMLMADSAGKIVLVNSQMEKLFGYTRGELIGCRVETLVPDRYRKRHPEERKCFFDHPIARPMGAARHVVGLRKDGTEVPIEIGLTPVQLSDELCVIGSVVDVTERRRIEHEREELIEQRQTAERLRERGRFFELSIDMVCIANTQGRFLQLNPTFSQVLGFDTEELLGHPFIEFVHPDDRAATLHEVEALSHGVPTLAFTNRYRCRDGRYRWLQWRAAPESDGTLYAVARDVTPDRELLDMLQRERQSLSDSLKEREVLLQEVHHRVKNNLQVISSLINMQLRQLAEPSARVALEECRTRIEAIALIHEKLYQAKDYARVPFSEYAKALARGIVRATGPSPSNIDLELETDDVTLPVDRAIPCALVLNELITNSLKHAFPAGRHGLLRVGLHEHAGEVTLTVADDGIGIPAHIDPSRSRSLGMQLVSTLSRQLDGRLELQRAPGTAVHMTFSAEGRA